MQVSTITQWTQIKTTWFFGLNPYNVNLNFHLYSIIFILRFKERSTGKVGKQVTGFQCPVNLFLLYPGENTIDLITSHSLLTLPDILQSSFGEVSEKVEWTGKAEMSRLEVLAVGKACCARPYSYSRHNKREPLSLTALGSHQGGLNFCIHSTPLRVDWSELKGKLLRTRLSSSNVQSTHLLGQSLAGLISVLSKGWQLVLQP